MNAGDTSGGTGLTGTWAPVIEVKHENNLVVCAELPGLKPQEVQVEVNDDALVIQGERRNKQTSGEDQYQHTERRYGRFYRAIPLPEGVNAEDAKATFNNGVLEVTVPLPQQQSRRRQIPIGDGHAQQAGTQQPSGESPNLP